MTIYSNINKANSKKDQKLKTCTRILAGGFCCLLARGKFVCV